MDTFEPQTPLGILCTDIQCDIEFGHYSEALDKALRLVRELEFELKRKTFNRDE